MQVALIRRDYITSLDGINRFIALLAEGLVRLGHGDAIVPANPVTKRGL